MSHTGSDPHTKAGGKSPAKEHLDERDRLEKSQQWERCRAKGLTVEIFYRDFLGINAWIRADEVEAMLINAEIKKSSGGV